MRPTSLLYALALLLSASVAHAGLRLPPDESFTLSNGAQVILVQKKDAPLVAARIAIRVIAHYRGTGGKTNE